MTVRTALAEIWNNENAVKQFAYPFKTNETAGIAVAVGKHLFVDKWDLVGNERNILFNFEDGDDDSSGASIQASVST